MLPQRTLLRHITWSLPSGQAIARIMVQKPLPAADFPELAGYGLGLDTSTPLFRYVLKEAELLQDGLRLGPVGGRIVGRALPWRPTLPTRSGKVTGDFAIADFICWAGVDPEARGQ